MEINHETVIEKLDCVYNELPSSTKINISFGFVLQSVQNLEQFRYYYTADNNPIFFNPMVLSDDSDLNFIKSMLRKDEIFPNLINQRPDTEWKFYCVINVTFFVFRLSRVPLGCIKQPIPSAFVKNPKVKCFVSDCKNKPYQDNLCMFRALAYELHGSNDLQQKHNGVNADLPLSDMERWRNLSRNTWGQCSCFWGSSWQKYSSLLHIFWRTIGYVCWTYSSLLDETFKDNFFTEIWKPYLLDSRR